MAAVCARDFGDRAARCLNPEHWSVAGGLVGLVTGRRGQLSARPLDHEGHQGDANQGQE